MGGGGFLSKLICALGDSPHVATRIMRRSARLAHVVLLCMGATKARLVQRSSQYFMIHKPSAMTEM